VTSPLLATFPPLSAIRRDPKANEVNAKFHAIVDKVQVIIYTEEARVRQLLNQARGAYR
jgi:CO dehydrogenase/acetyl-CoA synthase beta subunit